MKTSLWVKQARICIQSCCPIAKFNDFLLEMCNFNPLKNTTIWKKSDINNLVKSIKNELCERYNIMWKVQIQQLSKLQVFNLVKLSKINLLTDTSPEEHQVIVCCYFILQGDMAHYP